MSSASRATPPLSGKRVVNQCTDRRGTAWIYWLRAGRATSDHTAARNFTGEATHPSRSTTWFTVTGKTSNGVLFTKADIGDRQVLEEILKHHQVQAVMHFAAFAYVGESVTDPKKYYENNLKGTISLLDCAD